jgi:hypothetical protein
MVLRILLCCFACDVGECKNIMYSFANLFSLKTLDGFGSSNSISIFVKEHFV